jgi:His-Xaa-Ser system radical SAM maturase HxsC
LLDPARVEKICLTGGEPTLYEEEFLAILQICKQKFPHANVMVLTNGKQLSDLRFAKKVANIGLKGLLFCVSLHADIDALHDAIVGVEGSFAKTIAGIQNLGRLSQPVEIRFVISKMNYKRMETFPNFIFRNFPFVVHVAFMGLEMTGLAVKNYSSIWVDPTVYQAELATAVKDLKRRAINTSIYNLPFCLLRKESWGFARKSISGWKNSLLPVCDGCGLSEACCGVFTTSGALQSSNIRPLSKEPTVCSSGNNLFN